MSRALWRELLDNPTVALDPESAGITIISSGQDAAHRYAVRRWLGIRTGEHRDQLAAIAVILAEAFADTRALESMAAARSEPYPDEIGRFDAALGPQSPVAEVFGERILGGLRRYLDEEADLPFTLLAAAHRFELDDQGELYLPLRRVAIERTAGSSSATLGESFADRALETATVATPNRPEIQRTVLAQWGVDIPLDEAPIEESRPGFAPTRWIATCNLIARVRSVGVANRLIELARSDSFWETPTTDAAAFVHALEASVGRNAQAALLAITRADVSVSRTALRALSDREQRVINETPSARSRFDAVTALLRSIVPDTAIPDEDSATAIIERIVHDREMTDRQIVVEVLRHTGRAQSTSLIGQFEPPFVEVIDAVVALSGNASRYESAFVDPAESPNEWTLRYVSDGKPEVHTVYSAANRIPEASLSDLLRTIAHTDAPRSIVLLECDGLDAVIGLLDSAAWEELEAALEP
ncbi:MAG: hypothetical protein ACTHXA_01475 [Gulosibacter sp.]|uniref:hypothetical protein n=1 Tax=Gulosibacter sp. TaxID=2817531 RepID=UPI003F9133D4